MAARSKGAPNRARAGPVDLGLFRPSSAPAFVPVASRVIPYLCVLACGPLMSFPSRLRLESLPSKPRCFPVESLKICMLTLRSLGHLESCSSLLTHFIYEFYPLHSLENGLKYN
jgi:hypothetical protein